MKTIDEMRIIDVKSEEAIEDLQERLARKQEEKLKEGNYTINDFALVRTTNFLEEDHILKPLCTIPFVTKINNVASNAIFHIITENNTINLSGEDKEKRIKELAENYTPLSSQYRSTIHFTLNGLVSSHSKGTFDNQNFIIIDKLNKHLDDDIRSIRMEDTFISGNFKISDESILLINKDKFPQLFATYPWLESYNVVLYEGNEKMAVEAILLEMGITPEKIETNSAEYTERSRLYEDFLDKISSKHGIEREKHVYSKEIRDDDIKNIPLWQIYDKHFYQLLFNYFNINKKISEDMIKFLAFSELNIMTKQENMLKEFILNVGIDNYCKFVLKYNQDIMDSLNEGTFPTNDQILNDQEIILKEKNKVL